MRRAYPIDRKRPPMLRISLPYVIQLNNELEKLSSLPDEDVPQWPTLMSIIGASAAIRQLLTGSVYSPYLRSSSQHGNDLLSMLDEHISGEKKDRENFFALELIMIKNKYQEYRVALLSELESLATFFVTQKGGYDTATLLDWGEALFSEDLGLKAPEAVFDAKQSAKCLAFEVSTAAGFHLFRVTEAVLRRYYSHVTNGKTHPKHRNISVYLRSLRKAGVGDPKIIATLQQISDLHRNPLVHPEIALTLDEVLATAGMVRSATTAMLAKMPVPPQTTIGALSIP